MTQPDYVPLQESDRVRPSLRLPPPTPWRAGRPGELAGLLVPSGPGLGSTGPDLGYGLKLARRMEDRVILAGEHLDDVVAGCFACGTRRASRFGRAPVIHDMEWAFGLWGYLDPPPDDLVEHRAPLFRGAAEHYAHQRGIADSVAPDTLELTPAQVRAKVGSWRELLVA